MQTARAQLAAARAVAVSFETHLASEHAEADRLRAALRAAQARVYQLQEAAALGRLSRGAAEAAAAPLPLPASVPATVAVAAGPDVHVVSTGDGAVTVGLRAGSLEAAADGVGSAQQKQKQQKSVAFQLQARAPPTLPATGGTGSRHGPPGHAAAAASSLEVAVAEALSPLDVLLPPPSKPLPQPQLQPPQQPQVHSQHELHQPPESAATVAVAPAAQAALQPAMEVETGPEAAPAPHAELQVGSGHVGALQSSWASASTRAPMRRSHACMLGRLVHGFAYVCGC